MHVCTATVAFEGIKARLVEVQATLAPGLPGFSIVGLPDKAVSEARERVRASLARLSISLPSKRLTVNLSPADLPKSGSHFDLPIALSVLAALEILPAERVSAVMSLGELALDGRLSRVDGALPAALAAAEHDLELYLPIGSADEAAWCGTDCVFGAEDLGTLLNHLSGRRKLNTAQPGAPDPGQDRLDMADVRGQERARRGLEIAAAGRHHLMMLGPPGSGKSMLAARLPGLMPDLLPEESLESSTIHSVAGQLRTGVLRRPPYRAPHHTASMAALVGGGRNAGPGEISLAHNGVLFLDELPEFQRQVLETLRQPMETGEVIVSRANAHMCYPCRFLLVTAANPCPCGMMSDPARACSQAPSCGDRYLGRISGPLLDRIDLRLDVPPVALRDLERAATGESTADVAARVIAARRVQMARFRGAPGLRNNADMSARLLDEFARPEPAGHELALAAAEKLGLSARSYHRILRVARTIADLAGAETIARSHIAEALAYRLPGWRLG